MSTGLPFDRTRYNPVQDVTPEEAERNKRTMGKNQAAQDGPGRADQGAASPDQGKASD